MIGYRCLNKLDKFIIQSLILICRLCDYTNAGAFTIGAYGSLCKKLPALMASSREALPPLQSSLYRCQRACNKAYKVTNTSALTSTHIRLSKRSQHL